MKRKRAHTVLFHLHKIVGNANLSLGTERADWQGER